MFKQLSLFILMLTLTIPSFADSRTRAAAHGPSGNDAISASTITGTVSHVSGSLLFVGAGFPGIAIDASHAKISGVDSLAAITAGARIFVTLSDAKSRPMIASNVVAIPDPELLITGVLDSVDAAHGQFSLLGITVNVAADTVYGGAIPFASIKNLANFAAGQVVAAEIHIAVSPADAVTYTAKKLTLIAVAASAPSVVRGVVHSIAAGQWVIDQTNGTSATIAITSDTKIVGSPVAGDSVEVTVLRDATGTLVALAIVNTTKATQGGNVIIGTVKSINGKTWTIEHGKEDTAVDVNGATLFVGDPKVGDHVQVRVAIPFVPGNLIAIEIRKL